MWLTVAPHHCAVNTPQTTIIWQSSLKKKELQIPVTHVRWLPCTNYCIFMIVRIAKKHKAVFSPFTVLPLQHTNHVKSFKLNSEHFLGFHEEMLFLIYSRQGEMDENETPNLDKWITVFTAAASLLIGWCSAMKQRCTNAVWQKNVKWSHFFFLHNRGRKEKWLHRRPNFSQLTKFGDWGPPWSCDAHVTVK